MIHISTPNNTGKRRTSRPQTGLRAANSWLSGVSEPAGTSKSNRYKQIHSSTSTALLYSETRRWWGDSYVNCDANDVSDVILLMTWSNLSNLTTICSPSVFFVDCVVSTWPMQCTFMACWHVLVSMPTSCPHCDKPLAHLGQIKLSFEHQGEGHVASRAVL